MSVSGSVELTALSVVDISRRVRERSVRARDVTEAFLQRIEEVNPELVAVVEVLDAQARADADQIDRTLAAGYRVGPLCGVPFTVKDILATEEGHTTAGSLLLRENCEKFDATVVERARSAGAILVGKTNTPEFAMWMQTSNRLFGLTRSPVRGTLPGGSSGGEAAAVAAGMSAFGIGTDFGGSIRWPAHCTGLFGLRPTPGLVPLTGFVPGFRHSGRSLPDPESMLARLCVVGVLTHSASDLHLVLAQLQGPDEWDPMARHHHHDGADAASLSELRIHWASGEPHFVLDVEVRAVLESARNRAERLTSGIGGFPVELLERSYRVYSEIRALEPLAEIRALSRGREEQLTERVARVLDAAPSHSIKTRDELWAEAREVSAEFFAAMGDILILPTAGTPALSDDDDGPVRVNGSLVERRAVTAINRATALIGAPILNVPVGSSSDGRPIGIQVVARPGRELDALAFSEALASVSPTRSTAAPAAAPGPRRLTTAESVECVPHSRAVTRPHRRDPRDVPTDPGVDHHGSGPSPDPRGRSDLAGDR